MKRGGATPRIVYAAIVFAEIVLILSGSRVSAQTLVVALTQAYQHNPQIQAQRALVRAADESVAQAESGWRPQISANAERGYGRQSIGGGNSLQDSFYTGRLPTASYGVTVDQPLFQSGQTLTAVSAAKNSVAAQRAHLSATEQSVLLQVANDYLDVVRNRAVVNILKSNQQNMEEQLRTIEIKHRAGELNRVDLAQARVASNGADVQRIAAEAELQKSELSFQQDVGSFPGSLQTPQRLSSLPNNQDEAVELALRENPDIRSAYYTLQAQSDKVSEIRTHALPTVDMQASYFHEEDSLFKNSQANTSTIIFRLTWPIYQGGIIESQSREAEQTEVSGRYRLEASRDQVRARVATAWEQLRVAEKSVASYQQIVTSNEDIVEGVRIQQHAGEKAVLDLLNAENALLDARLSLTRMQHDALADEFQLSAAVGRLTAMGLHLPTPYYDASKNYDEVRGAWFGFGAAETSFGDR